MITAHQPLEGAAQSAPSAQGAPSAPDVMLELAEYVSTECFPATRDSLLAALIGRHAPTRLLWQVGRLSPRRSYTDVHDVRQALSTDEPVLPLEPM